MKEQTKKRIASALLAGTLLFTTGCTSKNKKNDDNNKVEPPKVVIDVDQNNTKEDKNIVRVHNFAYVTNDTPLYDSKMNEIEVIDKYQRVFVYNITDDMAMIHYFVEKGNMKVGYVYNDSIEMLPDLFVEVDISDQVVRLYKDKKILLVTDTVTGNPETPTYKGYFSVTYKECDTYLVGPGYRSHVDYWIPFDGDNGLHDASWRSTFGGDIYLENGSHGCVNLPNEAAETIYDNVEAGTKVLVHR